VSRGETAQLALLPPDRPASTADGVWHLLALEDLTIIRRAMVELMVQEGSFFAAVDLAPAADVKAEDLPESWSAGYNVCARRLAWPSAIVSC
jgi:hypothetical protein